MGKSIRDDIVEQLENLSKIGVKFGPDSSRSFFNARAFFTLLELVNNASGSLDTLESHFKNLDPKTSENFLLMLMAITQNTMMRTNLGSLNCEAALDSTQIERWHTKDSASLSKVGDVLKKYLAQLGYSDAVLPTSSHAEIAILNGAAESRIKSRLQFLLQMIKEKKLDNIKHILIFSGSRPLYSREQMQTEFTTELFESAKKVFTDFGQAETSTLYGKEETELAEVQRLFDVLMMDEAKVSQYFDSRKMLHENSGTYVLTADEQQLHTQFDEFFNLLVAVVERLQRENATVVNSDDFKAILHVTSLVHEATMAHQIVKSTLASDPKLAHIQVHLVNAPMKANRAGNLRIRPTSDDTYVFGKPLVDTLQSELLLESKSEKSPAVISVSNNPYVGYQGATAQRLLGVEVETIGHAASKQDTIVTLLDAVSRWVFASTVNYLCLHQQLSRTDAMSKIAEAKNTYPKIEKNVEAQKIADSPSSSSSNNPTDTSDISSIKPEM